MNKLIAICGLNCEECEAFIATKNNDDNMRKKLATEWSKLYQHDFKFSDINCVGCKIEGQHIGYCGMCEVRKCGLSKNAKSCGLCSNYPDCDTLNGFLKMAPPEGAEKIKANLEKIKTGK
ncbi:MAG TPA: DUF3795 domain-containing protein [Spirochaetota bacterium]|nr:DUF3795 domain-containing protein [Spirochaetota bacterium]